MLNDEEKKAIEYFKDDINYLEDNLKYPNFLGKFITIGDKEVVMLKTLLNLIEKQEREIEEADKIIDNSIEEQKEREKYTHSLEEKIENQKSTLELYCKNYGLQKDKIEKQSKVIDEMATAFSNINEIRMMQGKACYISPEEIKKKFYRKVEEDE